MLLTRYSRLDWFEFANHTRKKTLLPDYRHREKITSDFALFSQAGIPWFQQSFIEAQLASGKRFNVAHFFSAFHNFL